MREIKFRGKRLDNGEWVYGSLVLSAKRVYIIELVDDTGTWAKSQRLLYAEVDPTTTGQHVGLGDKNDKEIYEGDIVRYHPEMNAGIGRVVYLGSGFYVTDEFNGLLDDFAVMGIEVIGNIHDNPGMVAEEFTPTEVSW